MKEEDIGSLQEGRRRMGHGIKKGGGSSRRRIKGSMEEDDVVFRFGYIDANV